MGHSGVGQEEYFEAWSVAARDTVWLPAKKCYARGAVATAAEKADGLRAEFEAVRGQMEREAHKAAKLEKKAGIVITVRPRGESGRWRWAWVLGAGVVSQGPGLGLEALD